MIYCLVGAMFIFLLLDWETVVDDLSCQLRSLKEANTQLNLQVRLVCYQKPFLTCALLQLEHEKSSKNAADGRLYDLSIELHNIQVKK